MTKTRETLQFSAVSKDLTPREQSMIIDLALNILAERLTPGQLLTNPSETTQYLQLKLGDYKNEVFVALFLDNRHRVISYRELFFGTINSATIYPRVVVQQALETNAGAIIFAHNHPSGIAEPSSEDCFITKQLKEALSLIDVRVLDHFVVSSAGCTSFAERGLL